MPSCCSTQTSTVTLQSSLTSLRASFASTSHQTQTPRYVLLHDLTCCHKVFCAHFGNHFLPIMAHFDLPIFGFNPLTTEFFPPRQHIFMHSAHTTFVGTPLPQHSLLSGQTWWGPHTWRDPSGNTVNDIHDPPQGQQSEVKGGCQPDFRPAFP